MPASALTRSIRTTALLLLAFVAPAFGQENTATVETGGPPTTEYAIPLQSARQEAAGGASNNTSSQDGNKTPLFGVGVESAKGKQGSNTGASTKNPGRKKQDKAVAPKTHRAGPVVLPTAVPASAPSGGISTPGTIGGLALAVLLLGGVLGSIARRRRVP